MGYRRQPKTIFTQYNCKLATALVQLLATSLLNRWQICVCHKVNYDGLRDPRGALAYALQLLQAVMKGEVINFQCSCSLSCYEVDLIQLAPSVCYHQPHTITLTREYLRDQI